MLHLKPMFCANLIASIFSLALLGPNCQGEQDSATAKGNATIVRSSYGEFQVEAIKNSDTLSQALGINAGGAIIGSREQPEDANAVMLGTRYFYCDEIECRDMPIPKGYTNVEAIAISDNNLVVGFASRPVGHEDGSLHAIVWNPLEGSFDFLPPAADDTACVAQSISADGTRIAGFTTGFHRLRPALWSKNGKDDQWQVTVLPTVMDDNPYLMSSSLRISPDGRIIAGCCTQQMLRGGTHDSSLYVWREIEGEWTRTLLSEEQMYLRGLNNHGEMAASVVGPKGRLPCAVSRSGEVQMLELLPGDVAGEARSINEHSQIVGWSDEPMGPEGGPKACSWKMSGEATRLNLSESPYSMAYAINDAGQIAGMLTVVAGQSDPPNSSADEPLEMALAFRTK